MQGNVREFDALLKFKRFIIFFPFALRPPFPPPLRSFPVVRLTGHSAFSHFPPFHNVRNITYHTGGFVIPLVRGLFFGFFFDL